jgi:hypothetical protein
MAVRGRPGGLIVTHRTIAVLRTAALVPLLGLALLGAALAVAGDEFTVLLFRVAFLSASAAVVTGALRWSVIPSAPPGLVAGTVALWVVALHGAAAVGGPTVLVATGAVLAIVALRYVGPADVHPQGTHNDVHPPAAAQDQARPVEEQLVGRSTADLCRVWAHTGAEIGRATTRPDVVARLLRVREAVLAELERRDPSGVQRWLDTSPPATSNPRSYVREQYEPPQAA